jgi:hypothetical protein
MNLLSLYSYLHTNILNKMFKIIIKYVLFGQGFLHMIVSLTDVNITNEESKVENNTSFVQLYQSIFAGDERLYVR